MMFLRPVIFVCCLILSSAGFPGSLYEVKKCHQKIRDIICLVNPPLDEKNRYKDGRTCLSGGDQYQQAIIDAYDAFPGFAQKVICSLKKIYIENNFYGSAWSALADDNDPDSGLIGIRKKDLDAHLGLQDYNSWFEQQSFGGSDDFKISPTLPVVKVYPKSKKDAGFLTYTLLHEVGHILDFQHHFNRVMCRMDGTDCYAMPDGWTVLGWMDLNSANAASDFPGRKQICLNACHGKFLSVTNMDRFYDTLFKHGYISQLAALDSMEDWAEVFAIYVNAKYMNIHYKIVLPSGKEYILDDILNSEPMKAKKDFIERLY